MENRLRAQVERQARTRNKLRQQVDLIELDWDQCPPEEREQMRQELTAAFDRLVTAIRDSNVDEFTQTEQLARVEALRKKIGRSPP
jgi:hypothetical protein